MYHILVVIGDFGWLIRCTFALESVIMKNSIWLLVTSATAERKAVFYMHIQLLHDVLLHFRLRIVAQCQLSTVNLSGRLLSFFIVTEEMYSFPFLLNEFEFTGDTELCTLSSLWACICWKYGWVHHPGQTYQRSLSIILKIWLYMSFSLYIA